MGDSSCLLHGFSYASAVPNDSKQGNHMHALGESISFGRFTITAESEWDRWSTLSHKKYVEEAERYAQPGSVAQKKAFFEAHYKRIAAQRAAAAALLDQQLQIPQNQLETIHDTITKEEDVVTQTISNGNGEPQPQPQRHTQVSSMRCSSAAANHVVKIDDAVSERISNGHGETKNEVSLSTTTIKKSSSSSVSVKRVKNLEKNNAASVSESSETSSSSQIEKPLLKHKSVDSEEVSSVMRKTRAGGGGGLSSIKTRTPWPSTPAKPLLTHHHHPPPRLYFTTTTNVEALDGKSSSSLRALLSLGSYREEPQIDKRPETAHTTNSTTPKYCPMTPAPAEADADADAANKNKTVSSYTAATPQSHNTRIQTPDPSVSASGRKTCAPKWHLLSAVCSKSLSAYRNKLQSPTVSTPFMLRTEERAAKRKQKLEEKFNATEVQKTQQKTLKEKAGNEFRKLSCSLCFKARPLPDFYKEREHTKKPPAAQSQSQTVVLGRSVSNKKHGTISMPPPRNTTKNFSKKKIVNQTKLVFLTTSLPCPDERLARENASPNIQHYQ